MKEKAGIFEVRKGMFVELAVASVAEIRELNRNYRGYDEPTDVLSFPLYAFREIKDKISKITDEPLLLGTLVVCKQMIRQRAAEEGMSYDERLCWTIEHGLRHLLGYNHDESGERWEPAIT